MKLLPKDLRVSNGEIYLRPITEADTEMVLGWRNSQFVIEEFFYRVPITTEAHLEWVRTKVNTGLVYQYIAVTEEGDIPFGCVYLQHYEESDNSIEAGIFLSPDAPKGIGIGRKAFGLMIGRIGFDMLNVDMVYTRVLAENTRSVKTHERLGFRAASTQMDTIIPDGTSVESIRFEMTKNDLVIS